MDPVSISFILNEYGSMIAFHVAQNSLFLDLQYVAQHLLSINHMLAHVVYKENHKKTQHVREISEASLGFNYEVLFPLKSGWIL